MSRDGFPSAAAIREEDLRLRQLRLLVDLTAAIIRTRPLSRGEAEQAIGQLRRRALDLFPDKGPVFDLIYEPRFRRLIESRFATGDFPSQRAED